MKVSICHISSAHRGLDMRIFAKECVSLAAAGYDTHLVITARPEDVVKARACGVTLHALPQPAGRLARMLKQGWRAWRTARRVEAQIYHFHDPELIPYGVLLRLSGKRVIYDVHEDLPRDVLDKDWIPAWLRRPVAVLAEMVERASSRWFFAVVAATPAIAERFRRFNARTVEVNNYPLSDELAPSGERSVRARQVCYVGGIARVRGIKPLVEALPQVPDARLVLCGEFADSGFHAELRRLPGWSQVDYRGQLDRESVRGELGRSSAGVVTFLPIANHVDAQPNKLFEYMSAELPVIASDFPLWRQIVDGAGAGVCVDPASPVAIARAIRSLLDDPDAVARKGKAGRRAVLERYNWPNEAAKLVAFYKELE